MEQFVLLFVLPFVMPGAVWALIQVFREAKEERGHTVFVRPGVYRPAPIGAKKTLIILLSIVPISLLFTWASAAAWASLLLDRSFEVTLHQQSRQGQTICQIRDGACNGWHMTTYQGQTYEAYVRTKGGRRISTAFIDVYACTFPASFGQLVDGKREGVWKFWSEDRQTDLERSGRYVNDIRVEDFEVDEYLPSSKKWVWPGLYEMAGWPRLTFFQADDIFDLRGTINRISGEINHTRGFSTCHAREKPPW